LTVKGRDGAKCIKCENEYALGDLPSGAWCVTNDR
jgi:hypothetical protein